MAGKIWGLTVSFGPLKPFQGLVKLGSSMTFIDLDDAGGIGLKYATYE